MAWSVCLGEGGGRGGWGGGGNFHGHVQFYLLNQLRVEIEYFSFSLNVPWKYIDKLVRLQ